MTTQGHAHVVHLHGDGIASEQAFVQQLDLRTLDEAQFEQTALKLDRLSLVVAMSAHLDDDAAIAASGLAQLDGVGQFYARTGEAAPSGPRFFDSDYQVRGPGVQQDSLTNCRVDVLRYHKANRKPP